MHRIAEQWSRGRSQGGGVLSCKFKGRQRTFYLSEGGLELLGTWERHTSQVLQNIHKISKAPHYLQVLKHVMYLQTCEQ